MLPDWVENLIFKTDDCWYWCGTIRIDCYGQLKYKQKVYLAHRFIYSCLVNEIPEELLIRHRCDNRICVNPGHLTAGTHLENMEDREKAGMTVSGSRVGTAKLNERDVTLLKQLRQDGYSHKNLAEKFKISVNHARRIIRGERWVRI